MYLEHVIETGVTEYVSGVVLTLACNNMISQK